MTGTRIRTIARAAALLALAGLVAFVPSVTPAFAAEGVTGFLKGLVGANPYPVVTAKHVFRRGVNFDAIYWIDNDRLLFVGHDPADIKENRKAADGTLATHLVVWNVRTGTETIHAQMGVISLSPCFDRGYIRYGVYNDGKTSVIREGKFGEERESKIDTAEFQRWRQENGLEWNPFTCRFFNAKEIRVSADHYPFPLRDEHGYLDFTGGSLRPEIQALDRAQRLKVTGNAPLRFYRAGEKEPIDLPIIVREVDEGKIRFVQWAGVYLLYGGYERSHWQSMSPGQWPKGTPQLLYLLSPDGKVTSISIPYSEGHLGIEQYMLTKAGPVVFRLSPRRQGAYLVRDGRFIRLKDYFTVAARESPDGCKLALAMEKDIIREQWLSVINLCK